LAGLTAEPFEAGVGSVAFDPAVEAAQRHAQLVGHLSEGATRIKFEQGEDPSKPGGLVGPCQFAFQTPALRRGQKPSAHPLHLPQRGAPQPLRVTLILRTHLDGHETKVSRSREQAIQTDLQEHAIRTSEKITVVKQSMAPEWQPDPVLVRQRPEPYHGMER
jgi:hypothetical protein